MSLLTLVQAACNRLGLAQPSLVMANGDDTIRNIRALVNQEGRELAARGTWQRLTREHTFTTVAQTVQTGAIPTDFNRFVPNTVWNYTEQEMLRGPLSPQEWQLLSAGLVAPPDLYFRVRGNDFLILPDPPAGETIKYEYVSSWWVDIDDDGVGEGDAFGADTNTSLIPEEILTLGIVWRWLKRNRMAYQDEFAEYNMQVNQALGRDGGRRVINMGAGGGFERGAGSTGTSVPVNWDGLTGTWSGLSGTWGQIGGRWGQIE